MNEKDPFAASSESVDAWADAELKRLSDDYESWIEKAKTTHNRAVESSLAQLEEMMTQSIEQLRSQNIPDAVKKSSIERVMRMYESQRDAIVRQLQ